MTSSKQQDAGGEAAPVLGDLEGQGAKSYGAVAARTDPRAGGHAGDASLLFRVCIGVFSACFALNVAADCVYLGAADARFPPGLGHLEPSEAERLQTVSYIRHTKACSLASFTATFCLVMSFVYFEVFAKADKSLRQASARAAEWWAARVAGGCCGHLCGACCLPAAWCAGKLGSCGCAPVEACCAGLGRCRDCCLAPLRWLFAWHSWRELLHGSVYLAVFVAVLLLLKAPFAYWALTIELDFGFANPLTVKKDVVLRTIAWNLVSGPLSGIPSTFLYLTLLQFRHGWLWMWAGLAVVLCLVQFNMASLFPMAMPAQVFPNDVFAVGRGFPVASTAMQASPWVSLNRIYFKDRYAPPLQFSTHDYSRGPLVLRPNATSKSWTIASPFDLHGASHVYAQGPAAAEASGGAGAGAAEDAQRHALARLDDAPWGAAGHVGLRSGASLRAKLFGWAKQRNISIAQIYLIDGSHKDIRANAFVGGMQDSFIGLYDTLFLGGRARDEAEDDEPAAMQKLERGEPALLAFSEVLQGVDLEDRSGEAGPASSAPTLAMSDDEIIAILAHELAHPALGHLEQGLWLQAGTSLLTFAVLGWAAHSPLLAAAFALPAPLLHAGVCIYNHILGPSLESVVKPLSDWLTRHNEYQADAYVAKMSETYANALQTALVKLSVNGNQDPDLPLWYEALHTDHPTVVNRWRAIESVKKEERLNHSSRR